MAGPSYYEGTTATNPKTGETVVLRNGQWVPTGRGGVTPEHTTSVEESLAAQRGRAQSARDIATVGDRFIQHNRNAGTGGLMTYLGSGATDLLFGLDLPRLDFRPERQAMEGLTSEMLRMSMVPGQSRSMDSNKEMEMTLARLPNVNAAGDVNLERVKNIQQEMFIQTERLRAMESWAKTHQSMDGFESAWTQHEPRVRAQFKYKPPPKQEKLENPWESWGKKQPQQQSDGVPVYDTNGRRVR